MVNEIKGIYEGQYRGMKQETRKGFDGKPDFVVDVLVLDMDLDTIDITCSRKLAEEVRAKYQKGDAISVEVQLKHFQSGIGISLLNVLGGSPSLVPKVSEKSK